MKPASAGDRAIAGQKSQKLPPTKPIPRKMIADLGYSEIYLDSRTVAVGFYEKLGYLPVDDKIIKSWKFDCKRMHKAVE